MNAHTEFEFGYRAVNAPLTGLPESVGAQLKAIFESFNSLAKQYWYRYDEFPSMENAQFTHAYAHIWDFYGKCHTSFEERLTYWQLALSGTDMFHEVMDKIHDSFQAIKKGNRDRYTI